MPVYYKMDYTDAEVLYLLEHRPWWLDFTNSYGRPPTIHEMRAKLVQEEGVPSNSQDDLIRKLQNEIERLRKEVSELKKEKEQQMQEKTE